MKVIQRYLIKEVLYALLAVTPILLLIFVSNRFLLYLTEAAAGRLPHDVVLSLLGLKSLRVLALVIPLTFYLSIVLALGRLYKDSEMVVLAACGVSPAQILRIVLASALGMAVLVAWLAMYVDPWANGQSNSIKQRAEARAEIGTVIPGRFKESRRGDHIFYAERVSPDYKFMYNVFIQSYQQDKLNILSSARGTQYIEPKSGDQFIILRDGNRYEWANGYSDYKIVNYQKYTLRIPQKNPVSVEPAGNVKSTASLVDSTDPKDVAELQWRLSMPISVLLLAMLGVGLARTTPRQGRYAKLFIAILVYIIYNNMMGVARSWVERDVVSPLLGMWWVHGVMLIAVLIIFLHQMGMRWQGWARWPVLRTSG